MSQSFPFDHVSDFQTKWSFLSVCLFPFFLFLVRFDWFSNAMAFTSCRKTFDSVEIYNAPSNEGRLPPDSSILSKDFIKNSSENMRPTNRNRLHNEINWPWINSSSFLFFFFLTSFSPPLRLPSSFRGTCLFVSAAVVIVVSLPLRQVIFLSLNQSSR